MMLQKDMKLISYFQCDICQGKWIIEEYIGQELKCPYASCPTNQPPKPEPKKSFLSFLLNNL